MRTIARCIDINQAQFIKMILEGSGIDSFIPDETVATVAPYLFATRSGVRVQVNECDEMRAKDLLEEFVYL